MQTKIHQLVTVRTVREHVTHEVKLPANLEGADLLAVLWAMEMEGLLEDKDVEQTDVTSSSTYYDPNGVRSTKPLEEPEDREVVFNEDGSIAVSRTDEDDPDYGTTTYAVPDPGPLYLDTATGVIGSAPAPTVPFATPILRASSGSGESQDVLIAADAELICETEAATDDELDFIVAAVNFYANHLKNQGAQA